MRPKSGQLAVPPLKRTPIPRSNLALFGRFLALIPFLRASARSARQILGIPKRHFLHLGASLVLAVAVAGGSLVVPKPPQSSSGTTEPGSPTSVSDGGASGTVQAPPTPTPPPIVRVSAGDKSLFNGDIDAAMQQYRAASQETSDPDIRVAALWGLARSQYSDERYNDAITTLDQLIADYPKSPFAAPTAFQKGESFAATRNYTEEAAAYQLYLTGRQGDLESSAN